MADDVKQDEYYPLRWKVADAAEDIFVLHRSKAIGAIALTGLAFIVVGFLALGWGSTRGGVETDDARPASPSSTNDDGLATPSSSSSTAPTTTSSSTTTSSTTTSSTTTAAPVSERAATGAEQLAATEPGAVIELNPTTVSVTGGLPSDDVADEIVALASSVFPDLTIDDRQIVDPTFSDPTAVRFRLSAPDLFDYNRATLNPTYLPLIDSLAAAAIDNGWIVEVTGHTDDTGPAEGNQRLSEGRAASAAQRLIAQGMPAADVTSMGLGEEEPIASNDTETGRLANRRVEFAVER